MSKTIHVLKPFVFSSNPSPGAKLPVERQFGVGMHELKDDDPMLSHPWIMEHFADGHIERPEQAKVRLQKAQEAADRAAEEAAKVNELAQQAFERTVANASDGASAEDVERELNTPVNQLSKKQGAGIDKKSADSKDEKKS